jgi:hypothetical protein
MVTICQSNSRSLSSINRRLELIKERIHILQTVDKGHSRLQGNYDVMHIPGKSLPRGKDGTVSAAVNQLGAR